MMKILLDEGVPEQVVAVLQHVLRGHQIDHVTRIGWSGKADKRLYPDAARRMYAVLVTNDAAQMDDPDECQAVKRSGIHRVSYRHKHKGLRGLAVAVASMVAAMPDVVEELGNAGSQRLVAIEGINPTHKRYRVIDPQRDPPRYWPR
jgi:hypothetical protein